MLLFLRVVLSGIGAFFLMPMWAADSTTTPMVPTPTPRPKVLIVANARTQVDPTTCEWFDNTAPVDSWGPLVLHACFELFSTRCGSWNSHSNNRLPYLMNCPDGKIVDQVVVSSRTTGAGQDTTAYLDLRVNIRCCSVKTTYTYRWADIPETCLTPTQSDCIVP